MNVKYFLKKIFNRMLIKRKTKDSEKIDFSNASGKNMDIIKKLIDLESNINNEEELILELDKYFSKGVNKNFFMDMMDYIDKKDAVNSYIYSGAAKLSILNAQKVYNFDLRLKEINFNHKSMAIVLNFEFFNYSKLYPVLSSPYFKVFENFINDLKLTPNYKKIELRNLFDFSTNYISTKQAFYEKCLELYNTYEIYISSPTKTYDIGYKMDIDYKGENRSFVNFECENFTILTNLELEELIKEYLEFRESILADYTEDFRDFSNNLIKDLGILNNEDIFVSTEELDEDISEISSEQEK